MIGLFVLSTALFVHSKKEKELEAIVELNIFAYFLQGLGEVLIWLSTLSYLMSRYPSQRCQVICILESVTATGLYLGEFMGEFVTNDQ